MGVRTHCVNGHEFTPENTYVHTYKKTGYTKRFCKKCKGKNSTNSYARNPIGDWSADRVAAHHEVERDNRLRAAYGITAAQYDAMFREQKGLCAICGLPERTKKPRLSVDHHHETKIVRELLCHHCNSLLGHADENIAVLERAIDYLQKHIQ